MEYYIIHIGTGNVTPYAFPTQEAAQRWLNGYGVEQGYKDTYYRIVIAREDAVKG